MRKKLYEILEAPAGRQGLFYSNFMLLAILLSIVPLFFHTGYNSFIWFEKITVSIFILDYGLRWLTADLKFPKRGKKAFLFYPLTPFALVDLLSILPVLFLLNPSLKLLRLFRLFQAVRVFKLFRYSQKFETALQVLRNEGQQLSAVGIGVLAYIIISALVMFTVEPESFPSFLTAVYWAIITITSVGYGDICPVSVWGQIFTMLATLLGMAVIALPTAIITAGYIKLKEQDQKENPMENYSIRDLELAPSGQLKIDWVAAHMPVLNQIRAEFKAQQPFKGYKIALSIHLEAKTAYLALTLREGGAEVFVTGSNPLSTQDDIAAALVQNGMKVYAWHNATPEEYTAHLKATLSQNPDIVIDDGGDLVYLLHTELTEVAKGVLGGCEETTTGVLRLRALEENQKLLFPMLAVNDAQCKHLFDNRYGTGESVMCALMRNTNLVMSGKTVVVMGYGWCGRGVASKAAGLGSQVIVCEVDPVKAIEAHMDGYQVMNSMEAVQKADMLVTVTGCKDIITQNHYAVMKDGAILANAGHFNLEINLPDLQAAAVSHRLVRQNIEEYLLADGRRIYLLGEGRLVNLAAGDGHPAEIMDLSFALQALSAWHLVEHQGELKKKVYDVSREIDDKVARIKLASLGIKIDSLSRSQESYLHSWNGEG